MSNVPKLRFKEFSGEWKDITLGDIGKVTMCKRVMKHQTTEQGEIPFYKIGTFGKKADAFISQELYEEFKNKYSYPKKGDILIAASGATYGKTVIFNGKDGYFQDSNIVWIANNEILVYNQFLYTCYQRIKWAIEESTIPRLYNSVISGAKLKIPTLAEQEKIASFLTSVDTKIEQLTRKEELLQQYKKGVMQKIFNQDIRFKADDGSEFCEWEKKSFDEVFNRYDNLRIPISSSKRIAGNTPYYGANGIQDYVEGFTHDGEFILIAEDGANDLKNYPVQYVNGKIWVNNHAHVLQAKGNIANNKFLKYAVSKINIEPFLVGGGRAKLNANIMMKINIDIPSLEEQNKIANFLSSIDTKIEQTGKQLKQTKEFKKALLQQMFV